MGSKAKPFKGCCFWRFQKFRSKEIYQLITLFQSLQKPTSSCLDSFITSFHPSKQPRILGWKKTWTKNPAMKAFCHWFAKALATLATLKTPRTPCCQPPARQMPLESPSLLLDSNLLFHCRYVLLRFFFTPLVLGTIIIEGKQEKRTSQFVGLVFHNIYFLGIKGKQQKGIESNSKTPMRFACTPWHHALYNAAVLLQSVAKLSTCARDHVERYLGAFMGWHLESWLFLSSILRPHKLRNLKKKQRILWARGWYKTIKSPSHSTDGCFPPYLSYHFPTNSSHQRQVVWFAAAEAPALRNIPASMARHAWTRRQVDQ